MSDKLKQAIENAKKNEVRITVTTPNGPAYARMDGLTDMTEQKNFDKAVKVMTKDLYEDGFEHDEALGFFVSRAIRSMKTVKS
jgi:hypothetical protein